MSRSVHWVDARVAGSKRSCCVFVAKQFEGSQRREARIHAALMSSPARVLAPELLAVDRHGQPNWVFLEAVTSAQRWPWARLEHASAVLRALAFLHEHGSVGTLASHSRTGTTSESYARAERDCSNFWNAIGRSSGRGSLIGRSPSPD